MELRDVSLGIGDEVAISVSRIALTRVAVCLFGPLIVWALCLAAMPASDPVVLTAVGVVGLAVSLWLGQRLGSARLADLDVRLGPGDRADGNMGIVSGS